MTHEYDVLMQILNRRMSVRKFKTIPLPEGAVEKIVEAGRWAMSGANGQPWEFLIVDDPAVKRELYRVYDEDLRDYNFWMEQMRLSELRHPNYLMLPGDPEEQLRTIRARPGWDAAPALIVVVGDGRRQWATVMGGHTMGRHQSHLTDGLANSCMLMHVAAAAMGLGTQWVTLQIEDGFKRVLNIPDVMTVYTIIPVGYPDVTPKKGQRRPLAEMLHYNKYNRSKYMSNRQILEYITSLRGKTLAKYKV